MELFSILRMPLRLAPLALFGLLPMHNVAAQTEITNDYIYIAVEAEDHIGKDERWVLTMPGTPSVEQDPDGNHSDGASGSTYLELLPDIRVTHDDPMLPPRAYWGKAGEGPHADYLVDFPEPGRYYVHVRAYSTGTEDNGIHFGLNGLWPESSERVQFCSASKRSWWWSSAQRDSGGNGSCGIEKSIWLDIPSAGVHTVSLSAREDGFEIDRFVLLKDLSNNTRVCSPKQAAISGVNCVNGSIESADGFTDLRLRLQSIAVGADPEVDQPNPTEIEAGNSVELTALIENLDAFDTATDIVLTLSPAAGDWIMVSMDNRCTEEGAEFKCTLDELHPTAPNENAPFKFIMEPNASGDLRIDGSLIGAEADDTPNNDAAATIIRVLGDVTPVTTETDVKFSMDSDKGAYEMGEPLLISAKLNNIGQAGATDVSFNLNIPDGLAVNTTSLPSACIDGDPLSCNYPLIEEGQSEVVIVELETTTPGLFTLTGTASAGNDPDSGDNFDSDTVMVTAPAPEPEPEPEPEPMPEPEPEPEPEPDNEEPTDTGTVEPITDNDDSMTDEPETDETLEAVAGDDDSGSGSVTLWFALLLTLLLSARLYWRHQRQLIAVRK